MSATKSNLYHFIYDVTCLCVIFWLWHNDHPTWGKSKHCGGGASVAKWSKRTAATYLPILARPALGYNTKLST